MTDPLVSDLRDARARTLALLDDLTDEQLLGPPLATVNPLLWELGHVAWFQEKWALRRARGGVPIHPHADALFDSAAVVHDVRWDLPLPSRDATLAYASAVLDRVCETLDRREPSAEDAHFLRLVVAHEDMHDESFLMTRQTLAYPAPRGLSDGTTAASRDAADDASVPGGTLLLGAPDRETFVFDNERCTHPIELRAFAIAKRVVTQGEFAEFVDDGGYARAELWTDEGRAWREAVAASHPIFWRRDGGGWSRRVFDAWRPLEPDVAMSHVSWHEANAWCRWARRRLPTEAEWEAAAGGYGAKPRFPWGDAAPRIDQANLDARTSGPIAAAALPAGASGFGCRQMIGGVWEWTSSDFLPYPGFVPGAYAEYSAPWFGTHKVLRGGAWSTRARLLRITWRNFYAPDRRDVFAGFRTCAL
jgi:gamma-glutamyl hercynylcysteine S-oxide synthase